jgi:DNA-binding IclR family transcriptional regulator
MVSTAKLKKQILVHLADQPMSLKEVAELMELKEKRTYRLLRSLFEKEQIKTVKSEDGARRYTLRAES